MANTNAAYGFRPRAQHATEPETNVNAPAGYSIASGYGTDIFTGDPVKRTGTGDSKGRPGIEIATPGAVVGVFAGCSYVNAQGEQVFSPYWPASTVATDIVAHVYDNPETIFAVQCDGAFAATDIANKADFQSAAGNTRTGLSGYMLDSSNIGTGDCMNILGLDTAAEPNEIGDYADVLIKFKEHEFGPAITAV